MTTLGSKYAPPPAAIPVASADLNLFLLAPVSGTEMAPTAGYMFVLELSLLDICVIA